jgi:hypothetical protein
LAQAVRLAVKLDRAPLHNWSIAKFSKDFGAGEWTRTIDLLITNQLLYQLSYAGQGLPR